MAHFASIDDFSVVTGVIVIPSEQEHRGQEFINNDLGLPGVWMQTSYNSRCGKRYDPVTGEVSDNHFRYNYAGVGYLWDPAFGTDGAFIPPKPEGMDSWVLGPDTACWRPPIPMPDKGVWAWNEETGEWIPLPDEGEEPA